jgi:hypothetical protein
MVDSPLFLMRRLTLWRGEWRGQALHELDLITRDDMIDPPLTKCILDAQRSHRPATIWWIPLFLSALLGAQTDPVAWGVAWAGAARA